MVLSITPLQLHFALVWSIALAMAQQKIQPILLDAHPLRFVSNERDASDKINGTNILHAMLYV